MAEDEDWLNAISMTIRMSIETVLRLFQDI